MGLDMYLGVVTDQQGECDNQECEEKQHPIIEEIGYWRKANAIHGWFIRNCADGIDECQQIEVKANDLIKLREECERVLDNKELAEQLLPPTPGFFFGSYELDEWYWESLEETVRNVLIALNRGGMDGRYIYQSSW